MFVLGQKLSPPAAIFNVLWNILPFRQIKCVLPNHAIKFVFCYSATCIRILMIPVMSLRYSNGSRGRKSIFESKSSLLINVQFQINMTIKNMPSTGNSLRIQGIDPFRIGFLYQPKNYLVRSRQIKNTISGGWRRE